jgi:hypothetical protein
MQLVIATASVVILVRYWIVVNWVAPNEDLRIFFPDWEWYEYPFKGYDWYAFSSGMALTGLACVLFAIQNNWHAGYPYVHSVWHILAALGQYHILCTRDAAPKDAVLDRMIWSK